MIYCFQCVICWKGYFGKTDIVLHKIVNGHRNPNPVDDTITDFQSMKNHAEVVHNSKFDDVYMVYVVKNVNTPDDLLRNEIFFIKEFNSKEPFGINIDAPMGLRIKTLNI